MHRFAAGLSTPCRPAPLHACMGRHAHKHVFLTAPQTFQALDLLPSLMSANLPEGPSKMALLPGTLPNTANSTHISEGYFCSAAGLVLPPWLTGWPAHLVIRDTPTQALCSLGQQLRPPQGWGAATLGVCCPGHTSLKQIEGVKENTFLPSVSMPTASSQVLSVFLCPPCPQQGQP